LIEREHAMMKEERSPEEILELHELRRADPQRFLEVIDEWLQSNPNNFRPYVSRHFVWSDLGQPRRALADMDKVIELAPTQAAFCCRGRVYRELGEHANALADFRRGEAIDPKEWEAHAITLLYQADSHAHLGDEASALECCARLPDNHWTPGLDGAPAGNKAEVAAELRRIAADVRRKSD
jgi:tetratricopeptide (TPR) repeat protein